jgi:GNAT superfamily N-acetyltransferase
MPDLPRSLMKEAREPIEGPAPSGDWPLNDLRWALLRAGVAARAPNARLAATVRVAPERLAGMGLSGPLPLAAHHDRAAFDCGVEKLNRQLSSPTEGLNKGRRTWVIAAGGRIAAFYVTRPVRAIRAAGPEAGTIKLVLVSALAVDLDWRKPGLARALVGSVLGQVFAEPENRPAVGLIGFALDAAVKRFFRRCGARSLGEAIHGEGVLGLRTDAVEG